MSKIFSFLIILILFMPAASAQEINLADKAKQLSVEVVINQEGQMQVKHILRPSDTAAQLDLIDGTAKNLSVTEDGRSHTPTIIGDDDGLFLLPSKSELVIEYELEDVLELVDGYWTMDFLYLESTKFIMPEGIKSFYVNDRAIYLDDVKGFVCHGCQMVLEYAFDEPKIIKEAVWQGREFDVMLMSFASVDNFTFDQPTKSLAMDVSGGDKITLIVPLELLWDPYMVFLNEEKIKFHLGNNNGTHVWLNMSPQASGQLIIIGTTVVPEFSILAPLVVGFLMIICMPLLKFNLR